MQLKTLFLPYDVYSRHKIVARLIHCSGTVLDVGGSLKELKQFLPVSIRLFSTDVIGGDVIYNGQHLPFKDKSVETVVSIDTVEHIPQTARMEFIAELIRVAKKRVVIAAPLGTKGHIEAEKKELDRQIRTNFEPDQYLVEHVRYGLPGIVEIKQWVKNFPHHNLFFQGNYEIAHQLFLLQRLELRLPKLGKLWYEVKKLIYFVINICLSPFDQNVPFTNWANRFYVQINV